MPRYLPRRLEALIDDALGDTRVVAVIGARQVGKSTLVRRLLRRHPSAREERLDRPAVLAAARADPTRFVKHDGLLAIDEVQRAPDLFLAIKAVVDDDPTPGRFLLTGSARILGLRGLPDALVGRIESLELWPFSQGELSEQREDFVDRLFADEVELRAAGTTREDYVERLTRGGFPEAARRDERRRARFFTSYVEDLVARDVVQLADIQRRDEMHQLLRSLAARSAQPIKIEQLSSDVGLPARTTERYLALFEEVFLIKRLPPWSTSTTDRASHMRKLLFVDTGLASHLVGRRAARLVRDDTALGPLLENFVLGELARQLTWAETECRLHHYRTRDGIEVDGVLEASDGRLVGVEVKAGETVRTDDFRPLRHLQARTDRRFHLGLVLYGGDRVLSFGDRMMAAPISALWQQYSRR